MRVGPGRTGAGEGMVGTTTNTMRLFGDEWDMTIKEAKKKIANLREYGCSRCLKP